MDEKVCRVFTFPKERPHFGPKQVRTLKGLKIGTKLWACNKVGRLSKHLVIITSAPYEHEFAHGPFVHCRVSYNLGKTWHDDVESLQDMSVLAYESGVWNDVNWFERL